MLRPFFQISLYTGQQLVLEAMQRWLRRPCIELEAHRARRARLKDLLVLLLKTAATGVLATVLDAAIEYRRRQLVLATAAEPTDVDAGGGLFPGLGALSRAGIASCKRRLLLAIDELERQAGAYGIDPSRCFAVPEDAPALSKGKAPVEAVGSSAGSLSRPASAVDLTHEERQVMLTRTLSCLRGLVERGDAESERKLDEQVDTLVDTLLGPTPATPGTASCVAAASPSDTSECYTCAICMDALVRVAVAGCCHPMCFTCARRLCAGQDHTMPACPFCRKTIDGFQSVPVAPMPARAQLAAE